MQLEVDLGALKFNRLSRPKQAVSGKQPSGNRANGLSSATELNKTRKGQLFVKNGIEFCTFTTFGLP
jgi:hypothetical protein